MKNEEKETKAELAEKPVENLSELITSDPPPPALEATSAETPKSVVTTVEEKVKPQATTAEIIGEDDLLEPPSAIPDPPATSPINTPPEATPVTVGDQPRKRGRPPGSKTKTAPDFSDVTQLSAVTVDYGVMAGATFDMTVGIAASTFGPEWMPRTPEERNMVVESLRVYLASKQVKDIPPGLMLTIILVAYSAPRLNAPPTREKLRFGFTWVKMRVSGFFRRRQKQVSSAANTTP